MEDKKLENYKYLFEEFYAMSDNLKETEPIIKELLGNIEGVACLIYCHDFGIRGFDLYKLYNDSCACNIEKFKRTILMLRENVFTEEEIRDNLDFIYSIPFISDTTLTDDIPDYGMDFGPTSEGWNKYCKQNREIFISKLKELKPYKKY